MKYYVAGWRQRAQEMFVPLEHPPGHAQVDFGEAIGVMGGVERKIHFFALSAALGRLLRGRLPRRERRKPSATAMFGRSASVAAFRSPSFMITPRSPWLAFLATGSGSGRAVSPSQSHYLFRDRFGRPGKGNDKGKVEGLVRYARRNFLVPLPVFESFEALNAYLVDCCRRRMAERLRGHDETIAQRLERDLAAFQRPCRQPTTPARTSRHEFRLCRWFATGSTTTRSRRRT